MGHAEAAINTLIEEIQSSSGKHTLDPRFFALCMNALYDLSPGYEGALHKVGSKTGQSFAEHMHPGDISHAEEDINHFFNTLGFPSVSFTEDGSSTIEVTVEDCPFTASISAEKPVCAFMAGFFSAVFYKVTGERYNCMENECRATGGDACVFTAKSASEAFLESF